MQTEPTPQRIIVGATGTAVLEAGKPGMLTEELPMIVWLRGDEPFAEEFCFDADAAMAELGIKRSRLTQISGKELRVGRIRIDRYTRPVYRRCDLEAYKSWTRSTATHQRASSAIEEAASQLADQSQTIAEELRASLSKETQRIANVLTKVEENQFSQHADLIQQLHDRSQDLQAKVLHANQQNYEELLLRFDDLASRHELQQRKMLDLQNFILSLSQRLEALSDVATEAQELRTVCERLSQEGLQFQAEQRQTNRDFGKALGIVVQFLREAAKKQEHLNASLQQALQQKSKVSSSTPSCLRRKRRGKLRKGFRPVT